MNWVIYQLGSGAKRPVVADLLARVALSLSLFLAGLGGASPVVAIPQSSIEIAPQAALNKGTLERAVVPAKSAVVVDLNTGQTIVEKSSQEAIPMASLTKLMTAYVIMQSHQPQEVIKLGPAVAAVGGESQRLGLQEGESFTVGDMLKALLIYSANDVAVGLASWDAGTEQAFVDKMNRMAGELGLTRTRYANASGLDSPGHVSSAADLAKLSQIMFTSPTIQSIVKTTSATIKNQAGKSYLLTNTNQLLIRDSRVKGLKTGYTLAAGQCLITYAEVDGKRLLTVLLGSPDRFQDSQNLVNLALVTTSLR